MSKYTRGDIVKLKPSSSWKRINGYDQVMILSSYAEQFGGTNTDSYTALIRGHGEASWFRDGEFDLVEKAPHLETVWRQEIEEKRERESKLEWVFDNAELLEETGYSGTALLTLGKVLGVNSLWDSSGESFVYYENARAILAVAKPYLEAGDIEGYRKLANSPSQPRT